MFSTKELRFIPADSPPPPPKDFKSVEFGCTFAPYMLWADWDEKNGWSAPVIGEVQPITLHPAALVLHFAVETMETLKAFRGVDDRIRMFRAEYKAHALNLGAQRATLPSFDEAAMLECWGRLAVANRDWIPPAGEGALYMRPMIIGTEATFLHKRPRSARLHINCTVWSKPFGGDGLTMYADARYIRAWPGGVCEHKMGCVYAPTLLVNEVASINGCNQVLWLFDAEKEVVTEGGGMNLCFVMQTDTGKELVTPAVAEDREKTIVYPGLMRDSILQLKAADFGLTAIGERELSMNDLRLASRQGLLLECFGCGTGAALCAVKSIFDKKSDNWITPTQAAQSPVAKALAAFFDAICLGNELPNSPSWAYVVDERH
uniref:Branched-chain-amino-acid transaminase n=1 Tax=Plectus sambesii TaxID=2011161 RepID=A0A914XPS1_9BILA